MRYLFFLTTFIFSTLTTAREPDVPFVPTPHGAVEEMLELAKVTKNDVVYDLGCGDGRIVVTAAKKYGAEAIGYDIDPARVSESRQNIENNRVKNLASVYERDIFTIDLSNATVVTLYLLPSINKRLIPQLEKMRPGSRIVSYDFDMDGVQPQKVITSKTTGKTIYLWVTPLKRQYL